MKPKNFPARKLRRQMRADSRVIDTVAAAQLEVARKVRTKKWRGPTDENGEPKR